VLYIVCALHCEAKPLIDFYKLSADTDSTFTIFSSQDVKLIIAGIGKVSTAAAMAYLYAKDGEKKNVGWLNVGIAGHKKFSIGSLHNINKVTDAVSLINWYPARLPNIDCETSPCITVDTPVDVYKSQSVYDMEASAFMATALRFSSNELIQVLKIISDNEDNHVENINKSMVKALVAKNIEDINAVVFALQQQIHEFSVIYGDNELYLECLEKWHFSQYQKNALQRLLQRWRVLTNDMRLEMLEQCKDSKAVIAFLEDELEQCIVEFS